MLKCNNVFWVENFTDLFCDFRIIPFKNMNLESQMNAMTRLIFFIFIILLLFLDLKSCLIFLCLSILVIILFYYIKKKKTQENFVNNIKYKNVTNNKRMSNKNKKNINYHNPNVFIDYERADIQKNPKTGKQEVIFNDPTAYTWYNDEKPFDFNNLSDYKDYNPEIQKRKNNVYSNNIQDINNMYNNNNNDSTYISMNQNLVGKPNPKTLIPPVIAPPIADLGYWKTNNLIVHSHINDQKQVDNYQSGYQVSTCCGANNKNMFVENDAPKYLRKRPASQKYGYKRNNYQKNVSNLYEYTETKENFELQQENNRKDKREREMKENFEDKSKLKVPYEIKANQSGWVNTSCGYNPDQLYDSGLPTNYPAGECEEDSLFKEYNRNLFTQTIQPGVYSYNEVNEPINSNIGISFTQQFEPTTVHMDPSHDSVTYIEHDPRLFDEEIEPYEETVNEANVYDPRFTGYGTSYRAYTDDNIGQTRFYYDDIDSVRMPNYIVRSNIDFMQAADKYGPMMTPEGNRYNEEIRNLANDEFLKNSLTFRTGLQERLMRKANAVRWQRRQAPIHTNY